MSKKNSVIGKIKEGFAESTRNIHEINRENVATIKADAKANFDAAPTTDPDFVKFKKAKGLANKARVVAENIKEGARENSEKERERRAEIQSHTAYRETLEAQKTHRQATLSCGVAYKERASRTGA